MLRPAGPDLARRLVSALLLAPVDERGAIVESIEAKMVELYAQDGDSAEERDNDEPRMMNVIDAPVQRSGYVEQKIHTYEVKEDPPAEGLGDEPMTRVG